MKKSRKVRVWLGRLHLYNYVPESRGAYVIGSNKKNFDSSSQNGWGYTNGLLILPMCSEGFGRKFPHLSLKPGEVRQVEIWARWVR